MVFNKTYREVCGGVFVVVIWKVVFGVGELVLSESHKRGVFHCRFWRRTSGRLFNKINQQDASLNSNFSLYSSSDSLGTWLCR